MPEWKAAENFLVDFWGQKTVFFFAGVAVARCVPSRDVFLPLAMGLAEPYAKRQLLEGTCCREEKRGKAKKYF